MYNVLHIMSAADAGGMSAVVLNYYSHINREKIHFDVALTTNQFGKDGEKLSDLGARFFQLPLKSDGISCYKKALKELLLKEKFDCIHVHENETSYVALQVAKKVGIKKRIAHAHTSSPTNSLKSEIRRLSGCILNNWYATEIIGCGKLAGERVFGKKHMRSRKAYLLPNAIDTEKFAFNDTIRRNVRSSLQLTDKRIIGMVARLDKEKNHLFALEVIKKAYEKLNDVVFVIVGNGPEEENIHKFIIENRMDDYVFMLGRRSDVNELYMAFDALLLPSIHEGFPVVGVEALATALPVFLSDTITDEFSFCKKFYYLPLSDSDKWASELIQVLQIKDSRTQDLQSLIEHNLDINRSVTLLENIYMGRTGK